MSPCVKRVFGSPRASPQPIVDWSRNDPFIFPLPAVEAFEGPSPDTKRASLYASESMSPGSMRHHDELAVSAKRKPWYRAEVPAPLRSAQGRYRLR
jgi:hypothetical protein